MIFLWSHFFRVAVSYSINLQAFTIGGIHINRLVSGERFRCTFAFICRFNILSQQTSYS
jgi:hypothetical protein